MKGTAFHQDFFIPPPSSFIPAFGRRSQVVRQRSAKPLFIGSIPIAASNSINNLRGGKDEVARRRENSLLIKMLVLVRWNHCRFIAYFNASFG